MIFSLDPSEFGIASEDYVQSVSAKQFGADPSFGGQAVQAVQNVCNNWNQ
jgi:hypothetical protein